MDAPRGGGPVQGIEVNPGSTGVDQLAALQSGPADSEFEGSWIVALAALQLLQEFAREIAAVHALGVQIALGTLLAGRLVVINVLVNWFGLGPLLNPDWN